jgi:hypothetical protein
MPRTLGTSREEEQKLREKNGIIPVEENLYARYDIHLTLWEVPA